MSQATARGFPRCMGGHTASVGGLSSRRHRAGCGRGDAAASNRNCRISRSSPSVRGSLVTDAGQEAVSLCCFSKGGAVRGRRGLGGAAGAGRVLSAEAGRGQQRAAACPQLGTRSGGEERPGRAGRQERGWKARAGLELLVPHWRAAFRRPLPAETLGQGLEKRWADG